MTNAEMAERLEAFANRIDWPGDSEAFEAGAAALREVESLRHALAMNQADGLDTPDTRDARIAELVAALRTAKDRLATAFITFERYADHHSKTNAPKKAEDNGRLSERMCEGIAAIDAALKEAVDAAV